MRGRAFLRKQWWILPLLLGVVGCREAASEAVSDPPGARRDIVESLLADRAAPRHPSDGQGSVTLEDPGPLVAGGRGRFLLHFVVGPSGIATGGSLRFQVSPFWGFSSPQTTQPERPGYTRIESPGSELRLRPSNCGDGCLRLEVLDRPLEGGTRLSIHYGAGPALAAIDRFAEREERFFLWVDGDGDGVAKLLSPLPEFTILPGTASELVVTLPSTARVDQDVELRIAAVDALANAVPSLTGTLELELSTGLEGPAAVPLGEGHPGAFTLPLVARDPGFHRVRVRHRATPGEAASLPSALSNPLRITPGAGRGIRWADLHGHSNRSDGTGTPEDFYRYAREVAGLDIAALTDHDHWGMHPLARDPATWSRLRRVTREHHEPGHFVTFLGFEWTSWIWGHRHVLYPGDAGPVLSALDEATDEPAELWDALRHRGALSIAHHPGGGPVPIDWSRAPDPEVEPVLEISSVHGSSECADCPGTLRSPHPGSFARDALARGYHLGFIASGDGHDGHPGLAHRTARLGGLAAIITDELSRAGVLRAIRERRVYATSGPRVYLSFRLGAHPMGSVVSREALDPSSRYVAEVAGTDELRRLDLIVDGETAHSLEPDGWTAAMQLPRRAIPSGRVAYLRVIQADGSMAWSSPIWVE